jgi:opacity protein-like surface antigen
VPGPTNSSRRPVTRPRLAPRVLCSRAGILPIALSNGFTAGTNRTGWVLGFGTEFAFTRNWSAKAETDYISFGDSNVTASDGSPLRVGMHFWEEKIGVNYRF